MIKGKPYDPAPPEVAYHRRKLALIVPGRDALSRNCHLQIDGPRLDDLTAGHVSYGEFNRGREVIYDGRTASEVNRL
tara:strand:+ start:588 stop:818 length:231 start_codon:yes stop_codon:yes gene_type:complete